MFMYFCYGIKESNLEAANEERIELKVPSGPAANRDDSTRRNPLKLGAPPTRPAPVGEPIMNPLTNPFLNMGGAEGKVEASVSVNANGNGSVVTTTTSLQQPVSRTSWATFE